MRIGTTGLIITCREEMLFVFQSSVYRRILVIVPYFARLEVLTAVPMKSQIFILIRSNKMQQYAGVYLLQNYSTCFGCLSHPSPGVHQTVTAASGTGHSVRATTFRQRGLVRPRWQKVVALTL